MENDVDDFTLEVKPCILDVADVSIDISPGLPSLAK